MEAGKVKKRFFVTILIVLLLFVLAASVLSDHAGTGIDTAEKNEAGGKKTETEIEAIDAEINENEVEVVDKTEAEVDDKTEAEAEKTRIQLLESALEPKGPHAAAEMWAEAVKTRNGALQYAIMSPELKKEYYSFFVGLGWVTGVSSPWIESYEIAERYRLDNEKYRFEVVFTYTDSTGVRFNTKEFITVNSFNGSWFISAIEKVDIKGEITKLTFGGDNKLKSIFVEDESAEIGSYDKANVIIGSQTKIYDGYTDTVLSVNDLKEGTKVLVAFTCDPMLMIYPVSAEARLIRVVEEDALSGKISGSIVYDNSQYGFRFVLPSSWEKFSVIAEYWEGLSTGGQAGKQTGEQAGNRAAETGPVLNIRHPLWTEHNPRQDIPIMIFTIEQWNSLNKGEFHVGAAPVGPKEINRSSGYVFALPARYNYAFPAGFEEVEEILDNNPLTPFKKLVNTGINTRVVNVYYACSKLDPGGLYPVVRRVSLDVDPIQAALEEMMKGPSEEEKKLGYISWFSARTAGMLNSVKRSKDGKTVIIDFADFRGLFDRNSIPSPTSFLTGGIMADITWTVFKQFPDVDALRFSFEGDESAFWSWLAGSEHEPKVFTRRDWEQV